MKLRVKFSTGEDIELDVDRFIQISALKMMIYKKANVPYFQQRLVVKNGSTVELKDNKRLCDYNVSPSDAVMLIVKNEERMQIFLRNDKGKTSTYDVHPSESVRDLEHEYNGRRVSQPISSVWYTWGNSWRMAGHSPNTIFSLRAPSSSCYVYEVVKRHLQQSIR